MHDSFRSPHYQIRGAAHSTFSLIDTVGTTVRRECPLSLLVVSELGAHHPMMARSWSTKEEIEG